MIDGVSVVGDLLRPDGSGRPGGVDRSTVWVFDAIKRQVHIASGLPVDVLATHSVHGLPDMLRELAAPPDAHRHWAAWYRELPAQSDIAAALRPRLHRRFVIGYESPPWLLHLLHTLDVPHIDLRIHPVRFLDDLMFLVRASDAATQDRLLHDAVAEAEVVATAGLREAMCHLISEATAPHNTLVVIGQRPLDCTQIVDGRFYDAVPHAASIHAICARYAAVLLKPHPLEPDHSLLAVSAAAPNVAGVVRDNIYRLMSLPQVTAVLTVNSSVAYEAVYFGKRVHALAPLPVRIGWRGAANAPGLHASLDDHVLSIDFWRDVLAPHTAVTAPDGMRLRPKPNRLRIALDSFWDFQQIDTGRIPR